MRVTVRFNALARLKSAIKHGGLWSIECGCVPSAVLQGIGFHAQSQLYAQGLTWQFPFHTEHASIAEMTSNSQTQVCKDLKPQNIMLVDSLELRE